MSEKENRKSVKDILSRPFPFSFPKTTLLGPMTIVTASVYHIPTMYQVLGGIFHGIFAVTLVTRYNCHHHFGGNKPTWNLNRVPQIMQVMKGRNKIQT